VIFSRDAIADFLEQLLVHALGIRSAITDPLFEIGIDLPELLLSPHPN
jgi:hypothetical protein